MAPSLPFPDLAALNPWWAGPDGFARDPHLGALARAPFQRTPGALAVVQPTDEGIFTLRGPRQVGKTTLLKQLARELVRTGGWDPRQVVYYSLDLVDDRQRIVDLVRQVKASRPTAARERWCFLLDEVPVVEGWQRSVKYLWDHDIEGVRRDLFVLSGSSAVDLRRASERLPGRRGAGRDLALLPLSFREFLTAVDPAAPPPALAGPQDLLTPRGEELVRQAMFSLDRLQTRLAQYAVVGGFPAAVGDFIGTGAVTPRTLADLWNVVASDVERWSRSRVRALRLLGRVVSSLGSPFSWASLAVDMDVTRPIAEEYANLLADAFLLFVVYFRDLAGRAQPRKEKKIYAADPLLLRLPAHVENTALPGLPAVIENIVGFTLLRVSERDLIESFRDPQSLCYWKSTASREIDFLAGYRPAQLPVEVKYQTRVGRQDTLALRNAFKRGVVVSRADLLWDADVPIVPAAALLALLDA